MRTRLSAKIDYVNNEFHCPLTPRNNKGELINCHECSAQQLFHVVGGNGGGREGGREGGRGREREEKRYRERWRMRRGGEEGVV